MFKNTLALLATCALASAKVYFFEDFKGDWESRWVQSAFKDENEYGKLGLSAGEYFGDAKAEQGLQTQTDARFYQLSAKHEEFSNKDKDLVLQFRVKNNQNIDCGGMYLKYHGGDVDQTNYSGETPYNVMFGPDICGSTRKVHVIFQYKGKEVHKTEKIQPKTDQISHLYTLVVKPDLTYDVQIDRESVAAGSLVEDFDFLPPKKIDDPNVSKPEDWVDKKKIPDPDDVKPEDWDDIPRYITDPDAEKPEDWDDELDGEWEAPQIPNPEFKGEWKPKLIDNPDYKGPWEQPQIDNPDYFEDDQLYAFDSFTTVGLEVWQVKSGTIWSDILIADSIEDANEKGAAFEKIKEGETAAKQLADEERALKMEEERLAREEAEAAEEDDEEDEKDEL